MPQVNKNDVRAQKLLELMEFAIYFSFHLVNTYILAICVADNLHPQPWPSPCLAHFRLNKVMPIEFVDSLVGNQGRLEDL